MICTKHFSIRKGQYLLPCLSLFLLVFTSCSVSERRLAVNYIDKYNDPSYKGSETIYVVLPQTLVHTNSAIEDVPNFEEMSIQDQDSIIKSMTRLVDKINDSIFLSQFNEHLVYNLKQLGIPVLVTTADQLPIAVPGETFILQIPQIEVQEFPDVESFEYEDENNTAYAIHINETAFNINVWYLFNKTTDSTENPVYFSNWKFTDQLSGEVGKAKDGSIVLKTKTDELNINDVYFAAYLTGKLSAAYYIEKLINEHVQMIIPSPTLYFFYDPTGNKILEEAPLFHVNKAFERLSPPKESMETNNEE